MCIPTGDLDGDLEPITNEIGASTAQMRRMGDLRVPGVVQWDPASAKASEDMAPIALEELTPDQRKKVTEAMAQVDGMIQQIAAQQGDSFNEEQVLTMVLMQMRSGSGRVPDEDRPAFNYVLQQLEARQEAAQGSE